VVEVTKDGSDMTEDELDQLAKEMYDAMLANIERLEQSPPRRTRARGRAPNRSTTRCRTRRRGLLTPYWPPSPSMSWSEARDRKVTSSSISWAHHLRP
jgi:hypothetical protein